jgi:predicted transcriptional regulator
MLISDQIRAARALVRWSAQNLADESGVSWKTIQRMEAATGMPSATAKNLKAIQDTLEDAGVIFIDEDEMGPGVRFRERTSK